MREKLLNLMKSEGLKPSQLAELLEINPAGISHILAGRNKPGFDLLQKILRRFPKINPDWLLLDAPSMYRNENVYPKTSSSLQKDVAEPQTRDLFASSPKPIAQQEQRPDEIGNDPRNAQPIQFPPAKAGINIKQVVIFYDDQTFESFSPVTHKK